MTRSRGLRRVIQQNPNHVVTVDIGLIRLMFQQDVLVAYIERRLSIADGFRNISGHRLDKLDQMSPPIKWETVTCLPPLPQGELQKAAHAAIIKSSLKEMDRILIGE
ncbi:MAG TPA: hypothetical protein VGK56_01295 [Anaerolineales bacterium]